MKYSRINKLLNGKVVNCYTHKVKTEITNPTKKEKKERKGKPTLNKSIYGFYLLLQNTTKERKKDLKTRT
jgi:hypothetical protein